MRKLDLTDYLVRGPDPFKMRENVCELCFVPQEGCKPSELLKRQRLCEKIHQAKGTEVLLEEAEWERLTKALEAVPALGRSEAELVRRILEAPEVTVQETPSTSPQPLADPGEADLL